MDSSNLNFDPDSGPTPLNDPILADEIYTAIKQTPASGKCQDADGIHPSMLHHCSDSLVILLHLLFNLVLDTGSWPWSKSNTVIFIKKTGKSSYASTDSFRPITISSYIGKLLERILEARLRLYVESSNIITGSQHGFRRHRSTSSYLLEMLCGIQHQICDRQKVAGLFLDLKKAFDSVWHRSLLYRLNNLKINGRILRVIHSFLSQRKIKL